MLRSTRLRGVVALLAAAWLGSMRGVSAHSGAGFGPLPPPPPPVGFNPTKSGPSGKLGGNGGSGTTTPPAAPTTGGGMRGGGPVTRGGQATAICDGWEYWWEANEELFLEHHALRNSTATPGATASRAGAREPTPAPDRRAMLMLLLEALTDREERVADSAALALGRVVGVEEGHLALAPLTRALDDSRRTVRESATLALGALGATDALPILHSIASDSPEGRKLTAHSEGVEERVRAHAAAAIGLIGDPSSANVLENLLRDPANAHQRDLLQTSLLALGMLRGSCDEIARFLATTAARRDLDRAVRAYAPTALARLAGQPGARGAARSMLPALVEVLRDPSTDCELRRSTTVALGTLAEIDDGLIESLAQLVATDGDAPTRHFALIALAEIGARDERPGANSEPQQRIERLLASELARPRRGEHRAFAAIALGIWSRNTALDPSARVRVGERLLADFELCSQPSHRGALALALGLARNAGAAESIARWLGATRVAAQKAYAGLALALLGAFDRREALRLELAATRDPFVVLKLARALSLLDDDELVPALAVRLERADTHTEVLPLVIAIERTLDPRSIAAITVLAFDATLPGQRRGPAVECLGALLGKPRTRFAVTFGARSNYLARGVVLTELSHYL